MIQCIHLTGNRTMASVLFLTPYATWESFLSYYSILVYVFIMQSQKTFEISVLK